VIHLWHLKSHRTSCGNASDLYHVGNVFGSRPQDTLSFGFPWCSRVLQGEYLDSRLLEVRHSLSAKSPRTIVLSSRVFLSDQIIPRSYKTRRFITSSQKPVSGLYPELNNWYSVGDLTKLTHLSTPPFVLKGSRSVFRQCNRPHGLDGMVRTPKATVRPGRDGAHTQSYITARTGWFAHPEL
jgi:hypothetical protein